MRVLTESNLTLNYEIKSVNSGSVNSRSVNNLKEFYIPDYILLPESELEEASNIPSCPVIVFINSRSGGQLGGEELVTYRSLLNKNQVFDLGEKAPDKVLHELYYNLEKHKQIGDSLASEIVKRLRIIVAGGDGTAGWLLGGVCDLKLPQPPPIATVPFRTGNNLAFSFGWGKRNPGTDCQTIAAFLDQVRNGKEMKIDSIRSIVCLNLPSFSGGFNPWGTPNRKKQQNRDFSPPYVDDGLIEIVGFRDAWRGLILLTPNGHGTRLAQVGLRTEHPQELINHIQGIIIRASHTSEVDRCIVANLWTLFLKTY